MTLTIPIVLAILSTVLLIAYFAYQLANRKKPMKQEYKNMIKNEELSKKQLEQQLERTQRELQQVKNDAISKENLAKAELEKVQKTVEATEWAKTQPRYYVQVTKLDGTKIKTQEFVANARVEVRSEHFGSSPCGRNYVSNPHTFSVGIVKEDAKSLAQAFIDESRDGEVIHRFGHTHHIGSNSTVIGDLTIFNHAIDSFEIIEVKAEK